MSADNRIKRPESARTQPIRSFSTLFGATGQASPPGDHSAGPLPPWAPSGPPDAAIPQSIATGYRIIEEYMKKGQDAARSMWRPAVPDAEGGQQRMLEELGRQTMQFATLWLDAVSTMLPGAPGSPASGAPAVAGPFSIGGEPVGGGASPASPAEPGGEPQALAHTLISIDIFCSRPAEVLIDLRPGSCGLPLRVHELRAPAPERPRLAGVVIESLPAEDRIVVRIRVPDELPPDVYSGIVLDEQTSLPRGTLSVRVAAG